MTTEDNLKCVAVYGVNDQILSIHFNKEIKIDDIPAEQTTKGKTERKDEEDCLCGNNLLTDDLTLYECQTERLEMLLLEMDGVNSVSEIKKYSISVEVGIFFDFWEVAMRIIDLMECLVFSGEEAEIISEKSKNNKTKKKEKSKAKQTQKSTKSQE